MIELKSCPFCKGKDIEVKSYQYTDTFYWGACCVCNTCGAKTGDKACEARYNVHDELKRSHEEAENIAKNLAIEAWNSRPELDRLEALNAELVEALTEAKVWLTGWASAERQLSVIENALEKAKVNEDEFKRME